VIASANASAVSDAGTAGTDRGFAASGGDAAFDSVLCFCAAAGTLSLDVQAPADERCRNLQHSLLEGVIVERRHRGRRQVEREDP
jgi:hypothetical protein